METNSVLDEILSDAAAPAAPAPETPPATPKPEPAPAAIPDETGRLHGKDGKFATKAGDPPAPGAAPAAPDPAAQPDPGGDGKTVPLATFLALREDMGKKLDDALRQVQQVTGQVQLLSTRPAAPAVPREEPKPKDFWGEPEAYVGDQVNAALTPVQQELRRTVLTFSHRDAVREFGAEQVNAATEALKAAVTSGAVNGKEIGATLGASVDPVGDVVRWHRQQQTRVRVGDDPDAWLASELEKRMGDPAFQAQVIERARAGANAAPAVPGQQPPVALPPTLNRLPGGASQAADTDVSSEALFQHAIAGR